MLFIKVNYANRQIILTSVITMTIIFFYSVFFFSIFQHQHSERTGHSAISNKGAHNTNSQRNLGCMCHRCKRETDHISHHFLPISFPARSYFSRETSICIPKYHSVCILLCFVLLSFGRINRCNTKGFLPTEAIKPKQTKMVVHERFPMPQVPNFRKVLKKSVD